MECIDGRPVTPGHDPREQREPSGIYGLRAARRPTHLAVPVARRERALRWSRLIGIGTLVVLGLSPVFLHHIAGVAAVLWSGADQLGDTSLASWRTRLTPVHWTFHAVLVIGTLYAAWDRFRAWRRARRTLRWLGTARATPGDAFYEAARGARVDPARLRIVGGLPIPAFTIGWFRPTIYVAAELGDCLSAAELTAVLAHEGAHVARRDPLLLSVLRFVGRALVWMPTVRQLAADVADDVEIRADDAAAGQRPLALATALLAVARWTPDDRFDGALVPAGMVGIARGDLLERRIRRLAGEAAIPRTHVTSRSVLTAIVTLALLWVSGTVVAHPGHEHHDGPEVAATLARHTAQHR